MDQDRPHRWYSRREVAALLGVGYATLEDWARRGEGPPCFRDAGGRVHYPEPALVAWQRVQEASIDHGKRLDHVVAGIRARQGR
jgi:hypothetical protein